MSNWMSQAERFSQAQREALIDLVVWAMYADREVAFDEHEKLVDELRDMEWEGDASLDQWCEEAGKRAQGAIADPDEADDYLRDIAARLEDEDGRAAALEASRSMVLADGEIADDEAAFLGRAAAVFRL